MAKGLQSTSVVTTKRSIFGIFLASVAIVVLAYTIAPRPPPTDMLSSLAPLRSLRTRFFSPYSSTASTASKTFSPPTANTNIPYRTFTSSRSANMTHDSLTFKEAIENRRSIYQLTKKSPVDDKKIKEIAELVVKQVPSSFNSQSARLVVLLNKDHDKFWQIVTDILKVHVPEDKWEHTGQRLGGFSGGYGTVLFYEAPEPVKKLQTQFPQYADKFPQWSEHTSAMHQFAMWVALEAEGFGCNLQHYNPLPDQKASAEWNIPLEWSLKAQLVFGGLADGAREGLQAKQQQPIEERLFVHGA